MATHRKPTQDELQEGIDKAVKDLEKPEVPEKEEVETPEPSKESPVIKKEEEKEEEKETPEPTPSKPIPSPDYKTKFKESSKENQKIYAKNRKLNQAIIEANGMPEPTEEELKGAYENWDVMSETEQEFAKETMISRRFRQTIAKAQEEVKKIEKWEDDVDTFADDPKSLINYPDLEGKVDEFRAFAKSDEHNSVPFKLLVGAFLHEKSRENKPKKGQMFETGTGGDKAKFKPKGDKISTAEAATLMKSNYKKYVEYLKAGKIDTEDIK